MKVQKLMLEQQEHDWDAKQQAIENKDKPAPQALAVVPQTVNLKALASVDPVRDYRAIPLYDGTAQVSPPDKEMAEKSSDGAEFKVVEPVDALKVKSTKKKSVD